MSSKKSLLKHPKGYYLDNGSLENGYKWHRKSNFPNWTYCMTIGASAARPLCLSMLKKLNVKRCVTALILLTLGTIIYYTHYMETAPFIGYGRSKILKSFQSK